MHLVSSYASLSLLAALAALPPSLASGDVGGVDHSQDDAELRQAAAEKLDWHDARYAKLAGVTQKVKLLGFNDFHGQLERKTVSGRPAGGADVLVAYLRAASAGIEDRTLILNAGDHVGASPPSSALLQDEPSVSILNLVANEFCEYPVEGATDADPDELPEFSPRCNVAATPGNHELDEGIGELLRLIYGGIHASGPFLENPWRGARYPMISANVRWADSGRPVLPPYSVKRIGKERIAVIGAALKETPTIVTPAGVAGLEFLDAADAANAQVRKLQKRGIHAFVVVLHQGAYQATYGGPTRPGAAISPADGAELLDIVRRLDDDVDVVVAGHRHAFTNALVKNQNGKEILVVQAFSSGTAYDDVDLELDPGTGDVVRKTAAVVTTWADAGPGLAPAPDAGQVVAAARAAVAPLVNQVVGTAATAITRSENAAGESALGNLIADAQLAATRPQGAQAAFMNPGGIRADIAAGTTTWGALFTVQPFANSLVTMDLTGAQVKDLLERQWLGQTNPRIMKTAGITYTWDSSAPVGARVSDVLIGGVPATDARVYRVTCNSYMATGGDNFTTFNLGTNRVGGAIDLDALVDYVKAQAQPYSAAIEGRITRR